MTLEAGVNQLAADIAAEFNLHRAEPHGGGIAFACSQFTIDTGQNVNTAATLTVTAADTEGAGIALSGGTTITVSFTGWVQIDYGVVVSGAATRGVPEVSISRASIRLPGLTSRHTYVRNSGGHNETSANASQPVKVTAGDQFTVTTRATSSNTTAMPVDPESQVTVRRIA